MPVISIPKACAKQQHRKVTVVYKEGYDEPLVDLKELLLARDMEPKDIAAQFSKDLAATDSLCQMQADWENIKKSSRVADPMCDFCGRAGPVLRCSGCMEIRIEVRYCNKECQLAGWKKHKKAGCGRYVSDDAKMRVKMACDNAKK